MKRLSLLRHNQCSSRKWKGTGTPSPEGAEGAGVWERGIPSLVGEKSNEGAMPPHKRIFWFFLSGNGAFWCILDACVRVQDLQCVTNVNFQGPLYIARVAIQGLTWVNFRFLVYPVNPGRPAWSMVRTRVVVVLILHSIILSTYYRPSEMRLLYFSTVGFFYFFIYFFFQSPSRLDLTSDCHNQYQYRKVVEVAVIWNMTRLKILPMWGVSPQIEQKNDAQAGKTARIQILSNFSEN